MLDRATPALGRLLSAEAPGAVVESHTVPGDQPMSCAFGDAAPHERVRDDGHG
jgi:hypothetical protein